MTLHWTTAEVKAWLKSKGLGKYGDLLCDQHNIDGTALLMIQEDDLKSPPLKLSVLGDIKRLSYLIKELRYEFQTSDSKIKYCLSPLPAGAGIPGGSKFVSPVFSRSHSLESTSSTEDSTDCLQSENSRGRMSRGQVQAFVCSTCNTLQPLSPKSNIARNLPKERWKTVVAFLYGMLVSWLTALVMTVVHDRVPDMNKYPPLPDLILDNVPHIDWAFEMTEITGMTLLLIWIAVVLLHKHRFIIARRFFSIAGTIFLLRCITMLITSLSVPGVHLDCKPRPYGTWANRLHNAFIIWSGAGMTLQGVRTCGDYMFSGHTVSLTLLNFFITEYTSRRIYFLHTFTWLCNCFGVFFILAAHEHYSIDVFVAFYITSRLFLYYHTLVNNRAVSKYQESFDAKRTWFYFPLFSFFEQNVDGRVPNEFELPVYPQDFSNIYTRICGLIDRKIGDVSFTRKSSSAKTKKR